MADTADNFSFDDTLARLKAERAAVGASPPQPDVLSTLQQQQNALLKQGNQNIAAFKSASQPLLAEMSRITSQPVTVPPAPQMTPLPQKADISKIVDPMRQMSPLMLFLSLAGGALTGAPLTGAFKAGAAYINGIKQGDLKAADLAERDFQDKLKTATETNTEKLEQYRAVMDNAHLQIDQKYLQLQGVAQRFGDEHTLALLQQGQIGLAMQALAAQARAAETLTTQSFNIDKAMRGNKPVSVQVTENGKTVTRTATYGLGGWYDAQSGQPITGTVNVLPSDPNSRLMALAGIPPEQQPAVARQLLGLKAGPVGEDDPAVIAYSKTPNVQAIAHYQAPPGSTWGGNSPDAQFLRAAVIAANPQYNANLYPAIGKVMTDFSSGAQGRRIASINVAIQHLNVLGRLATDLGSGDVRVVNAARQEWAKQFGSPAPTNFDAVKQIVGQEVVKAIVTAGGGVTERQEAQGAFARVSSPRQMSGAIKSTEALLAGQVAGLKKQYESLTQGIPGVIPFDDMLLPATKEALSDVASLGAAGAPAPTRSKW